MPEEKKASTVHFIQYLFARLLMGLVGILPYGAIKALSFLLGNSIYILSARRRSIATNNIRSSTIGAGMDEAAIKRMARQSGVSLVLTFLEVMKLRRILRKPERFMEVIAGDVEELREIVSRVHNESGGALLVTPHLGNWEILHHVARYAGAPMLVVARPPDNPYLRKLIEGDRTSSGQILTPKTNALGAMRKALREGYSLGILPDQATKGGLSVDFIGRAALTTPVPAMLALAYNRPILVASCTRTGGKLKFIVDANEPIWPGKYKSKREEITRITKEMNRAMQRLITKHPEQYLWMHNRWKTYG